MALNLNILLHHWNISYEQVYAILHENLGDLRAFVHAIEALL